jgi:hypothetical protein
MNNYSIKINVREGLFEVSGENADWVQKVEQETLGKFFEIAKDRINMVTVDASSQTTSDQLISEATQSYKQVKSANKKVSKGRSDRNPELEEKLTSEIQGKFNQYIEERKDAFESTLPAQAAIIAGFLKDELGWEGVDHNDLYTVYSLMGWHIPNNITAQLNNALTRNRFFRGITNGKYRLSNKGENFARLDSKNVI